MATQTVNLAGAKARRTTIALKMVMAVTGAFFVLFVLSHMYGNLKVFGGRSTFDSYAQHLRTIGEPILPYAGFLWIMRVTLIACLFGHAYSAFALWSRANHARPTRYAVRAAGGVALRSKFMRWGGVTLLLFLVFHLLQFTIAKVNVNPDVSSAQIQNSPYALLVASFQVWWVVVFYLLAIAALGMHLHHGVWSAAQTLGWAGSPAARKNAKLAAVFIAAMTTVGFMLVPLAVLFGLVK